MNWIDRLAVVALRLARRRFAVFPDGLGNGDLSRVLERIPGVDAPIRAIEPIWEDPRREDGAIVTRGAFESPLAAELPTASSQVPLERLEPVVGAERTLVLLQMWGDEGFSLRRRLARALAARGIATVLPVHPFYGRRRKHSNGPPIRTVEEFLCMALGAIEETRSLLAALRGRRTVGLGGFSMGSGFSVGASATLPFPVALALMGAAPSPARAFTDGVLEHGLPASLRGPGRARLAAALDSVSALRRPVLRHHRRAVILAARGDGFVPVAEARALAEHWRGAELRLIGGGHATLWFVRVDEQVDAVERAFERHEARRES